MNIIENKIEVQDASIILDLMGLELWESFFSYSKSNILITPSVIGEITEKVQQVMLKEKIESGNINIDKNSFVENVNTLYNRYPGLSYPDCTVLETAFRNGAIILSSDGLLRKIAKKNNLLVKGTVGIISNLHCNGIIETSHAISKLSSYSKINPRAPKKEIEALISDLETNKISQP